MPFRAPPTTNIDITLDTLAPSVSSNLPVMVRHNWARPFEVSMSFLTGIGTSKYSGAESRTSLRARPIRKCSANATGLSLDQSTRQKLYMNRLGTDERLIFPLLCDAVPVTAVAAGAVTTNGLITVGESMEHRRFTDRSYVMFFPLDGSTVTDAALGDERVPVLLGTIFNQPTDYQLNLLADTPIDVPEEGWAMCPAFVGLSQLDVGADMLTAGVSAFRFNYEEEAAESAVPPTKRVEDVTGDGFDYYLGLPIFDPEHDFSSDAKPRYRRAGNEISLGRKKSIVHDGDEPRVLYSTVHTSLDRVSWWRLLRFWESRKGQLRPFWFVAPEVWWNSIGTVKSIATAIRVPKRGYSSDVAATLKGVHVTLSDGTTWVREITNVSQVAGQDNLDLTLESPPGVEGTAVAVRPVWRSRFASDTFKEIWQTATVCSVSLDTISLLNEQDHELST